jgi:hypothetical protein
MKGVEGRDYGDLPSVTVLSATSLNNRQTEYHSFVLNGVGTVLSEIGFPFIAAGI